MGDRMQELQPASSRQSFLPSFASRTIYDNAASSSSLANYAAYSIEQLHRTGHEESVHHRAYSHRSGMSPQCACSDCHRSGDGNMDELYPLRHPQPQAVTPYFPQSQYAPVSASAPVFFPESSTSTPYEYCDASSSFYTPSQTLRRPSSSFYFYDSPSGSTTPLPTPPSQSPCYFPTNSHHPSEYSTPLQRPKSFSLPNPTPPFSTMSYENASFSQPVMTSAFSYLAPPVSSQSFDDQSGRSLEAPSFRRRSSTLSNLSVTDGFASDLSDGGDNSERHETTTPFVMKLAALLRENSPWLRWNDAGTAFFFAHHRTEFGEQLSRAFRHSSSHSFVRQLNIYNFKRLNPAELELAVSSVRLPAGLGPADFAAFQHPLFYRGGSCNLAKIKPKTPRKISSKASLKSSVAKAPSPRSLRTEGKVGGPVKTKF